MHRAFAAVCLFAPLALAAEPMLIVVHKSASSVGFYTAEGAHESDVPVGRHPHEVALDAGNRLAYITDNGTMWIEDPGEGGNSVSIVDLSGRRKAGVISLGGYRRPHGIALDRASGLLAVTTEFPDRLILIDTRTRAIRRTYDVRGKTPHIVTFGPGARYAYVSNALSHTVAAIELETGRTAAIPVGRRPEGSVLSEDGQHLYVVNRDSNEITIIDTAKNAAVGRIATGEWPVRIARLPGGTLACAVRRGKAVEFADPAARKVIARVPLDAEPISANASADGRVVLASAQEKDTVYVISADERKIVRVIRTRQGAAPDPALLLN